MTEHNVQGRWRYTTTLRRGVGMNGLRWTMIGAVLVLQLFMGGALVRGRRGGDRLDEGHDR